MLLGNPSLLLSLLQSSLLLRQLAEKQYQLLKDDASSTSSTSLSSSSFLLSSLLKVASSSSSPPLPPTSTSSPPLPPSSPSLLSIPLRQLSLILLRRVLTQEDESLYNKLDTSLQQSFKSLLLEALQIETISTIKNHLCDTIGDLGSYVITTNDWPELLPFIYSLINDDNNAMNREVGLVLLGMISSTYKDILTNTSTIRTVVHVFTIRLNDNDNNGRIVIAAIRALVLVLHTLSNDNEWSYFNNTSNIVISTLARTLYNVSVGTFDEVIALGYIDSLIEVSESFPWYFESTFNDIIETSVVLIETTSTTTSSRHLLIEFLVSLSSSIPKKLRKLRGPNGERGYFPLRVIPVLVQMVCSIDDDPSWVTATDVEETAEESAADSDVGETAIDR